MPNRKFEIPGKTLAESLNRLRAGAFRLLFTDLPSLLTPGGRRGAETREVETLMKLFRRIKVAHGTGDYAAVADMVHEDAVLRTVEGEEHGRDPIIRHLKMIEDSRHQTEIVAPKGGLVTVVMTPISRDGSRTGKGYEQIYRLAHDRLVELIDIGRTPDMVNRPESQPS